MTALNSLFCRHNRFTADCSICSKGTVLDSSRSTAKPRAPRSASSGGSRSRSAEPGSRSREYRGPYVSAGPYDREEGGRYEVRLEKVPGGLRLAQWSGGAIERAAPVLRVADVATLIAQARDRNVVPPRDLEPIERALGVEADSAGMLRIARWLFRPNAGWELQEAPVMLPANRFAEALRKAVAGGVLERTAPAPAADA